MSNHESQFLLSAYRPNGSDAEDPEIAAALREARSDPERGAAFDRQVAFDAMVAEALATVPPPADLRDRIIAGARVSRPSESGARAITRLWLPLAAAVVILGTVLALVRPQDRGRSATSGDPAWKAEALHLVDMVTGGQTGFDLPSPDRETVRSWLAREIGGGREVPLPAGLAALSPVGCKCIETEGRRIALVCLDAGGSTLHLTVFSHPDNLPEGPARAAFEDGGKWSIASWRSDGIGFVLAAAVDSPGAVEKMRRLLQEGAAAPDGATRAAPS